MGLWNCLRRNRPCWWIWNMKNVKTEGNFLRCPVQDSTPLKTFVEALSQSCLVYFRETDSWTSVQADNALNAQKSLRKIERNCCAQESIGFTWNICCASFVLQVILWFPFYLRHVWNFEAQWMYTRNFIRVTIGCLVGWSWLDSFRNCKAWWKEQVERIS